MIRLSHPSSTSIIIAINHPTYLLLSFCLPATSIQPDIFAKIIGGLIGFWIFMAVHRFGEIVRN